MTTDYARKCLELMGHEVFKPKRARKWHVNFVDVWGTNTFTDEGLITKAIEQLTNREDVMERVVKFTQYNLGWESVTQNKNTGHYWTWTDDADGDPVVGCPYTYVELLDLAIELGMTPEELLEVKG